MSELAVKGCVFSASLDTGMGSIVATLSTVTPESTNCLVNNNGIYFDKVSVIVASGSTVTLTAPPTGAVSPVGTLLTPDTIDISGTAENILENDKKAVQKDDSGSKSISFMFPTSSSPYTMNYSVNVTVKISNAGQTDVIAL